MNRKISLIKNINKRKIIIVAIAVFLFLLIIIARQGNKNKLKSAMSAPVISTQIKKKIEKEESFSRTSFFLTKPVAGSLAIPESWEGKYRLSEQGSAAIFYAISDPERPVEIFRINYYSAPDKSKYQKNEKEIFQSKLGNLTVLKNIDSSQSGNANDNLKQMFGRINEILASFHAIGSK